MDLVNGMSSTRFIERAIIFTEGLDVKDIKFIDDHELFVAVSDHGKSDIYDCIRTK